MQINGMSYEIYCSHVKLGTRQACAMCRLHENRAERKRKAKRRRMLKAAAARALGPAMISDALRAIHAKVNAQRRLEKYGF